MTREEIHRLTRRLVALVLVLAPLFLPGLTTAARAEEPGASPDPIAEHLFPPDLVMRHQAEIGLSPDQREALIKELQRTQAELVPIQFEVSEGAEELKALLSAGRIDEVRAVAQARRVMELEAQVKGRHLVLLVRIKNLLSLEQQDHLMALRSGGPR